MDITQVLDIAIAGSGVETVEATAVEDGRIEASAVGSLSQIVSELVQNGAAFSKPGQAVTVGGSFQGPDYVVSVIDEGVGIPEAMLDALNNVLDSPGGTGEGPNLGIALVARLAARSGLNVRLVPGEPGTTATVTIPARLIEEQAPPKRVSRPVVPAGGRKRTQPRETIDLTRYERATRPSSEHVFISSDPTTDDAEAFLEQIFGPLRARSQRRDRPDPRPRDNGGSFRPPVEREPTAMTTTLRVRVPGENFSVVDDEPSSISSETAIDIRAALSEYQASREEARGG